MKFIRNLLGAAVLICGLVLVSLSAHAGLQIQQDSNDALAVNATNTYALFGDITGNYTNGIVMNGGGYAGNVYTTNGVFVSTSSVNGNRAYIDCHLTTIAGLEVGGWFTNTAAGASNINYYIYHTVDFKKWSFDTNVSVSVPAASTNYAYQSFQPLGGKPYPGYAIRFVANTNTAAVQAGTNTSGIYFQGYTGTGI